MLIRLVVSVSDSSPTRRRERNHGASVTKPRCSIISVRVATAILSISVLRPRISGESVLSMAARPRQASETMVGVIGRLEDPPPISHNIVVGRGQDCLVVKPSAAQSRRRIMPPALKGVGCGKGLLQPGLEISDVVRLCRHPRSRHIRSSKSETLREVQLDSVNGAANAIREWLTARNCLPADWDGGRSLSGAALVGVVAVAVVIFEPPASGVQVSRMQARISRKSVATVTKSRVGRRGRLPLDTTIPSAV